jgi:hypothetical protein
MKKKLRLLFLLVIILLFQITPYKFSLTPPGFRQVLQQTQSAQEMVKTTLNVKANDNGETIFVTVIF